MNMNRIAVDREMLLTSIHISEEIIGYILSPEDLAVCKLAAGRDKDIIFVEIMLQEQITTIEKIDSIIDLLPSRQDIARYHLELYHRRLNGFGQTF